MIPLSTGAWPAASIRETLERLTAPGAPFETREEVVAGRRMRTYVRAVSNMGQVLQASRTYGERDLLVYKGERVSFDGHWRAAMTLADTLSRRFDVAKGDRVAVAMRNFPEWSVCAWATLALGAILVPLNAWEPGPALARLIADAGPRVLIADQERLERILPFQANLPAMTILSVRAQGGDAELDSFLGAPADYGSLPEPPAQHPDISPDDDATIFYTSGTTGHSKGAVGTHRNLATNLVNIGFRGARAAVRRGEQPPSSVGARRVQLLPLPFFHVTGFHSSLVPALAGGATIVLMHRWDPAHALDLIEEEQVNALTLVPSQAIQLVNHSGIAGRRLQSVDTVGYGGAAAPTWLAARVREVFPAAMPGQGYGATETSSLTSANSAEDMLARPGSVGIAVPASDIRVVGEDGAAAQPGESGEIWVFGPNVVRGYWNAPEASAAAFVDGWYRTGDIGRLEDEGFITLLDRAKDILIRGGENIFCPEIEHAIGQHESVAEVAVMGVPDPVLGEVVGAVVRLQPGAVATGDGLSQEAGRALAAHKRPVVVQFTDTPLPRNAAGKVLKRELKAGLIEHGVDLRRTSDG